MKPIALAAILAGGRGQRMGGDKVLLPLGGVPLVERVWARVAQVSERVVVVGGAQPLEHRGVRTVPDRYPGADSLGGIATALAHALDALGPRAWVLCTACDMPFLEPSLLAYLARAAGGADDVVVPCTAAGHEPLCALYRAWCHGAFEAALRSGNLRVRDAYRPLRVREVGEKELRPVDPTLRSFLNINRRGDLEAAVRLLGPRGRAPLACRAGG
jgi:molybdopterin-guanine dinucleotide biosynthesis protein A